MQETGYWDVRLVIQRKSELEIFWPVWRWPVRQKYFKLVPLVPFFGYFFGHAKK